MTGIGASQRANINFEQGEGTNHRGHGFRDAGIGCFDRREVGGSEVHDDVVPVVSCRAGRPAPLFITDGL